MEDVTIVLGHRGDEIRAAVEADAEIAALPFKLRFVTNPEWHTAMGSSILAVRPYIQERALVLLSDHIWNSDVLSALVDLDPRGPESVMVVDRDLGRVFGMQDVRKIQLDGNRVIQYGRDIDDYNAVSCGVFALSPEIFRELERTPEPTIEDGVLGLARRGLIRARDIFGMQWIALLTPEAKRHADWMLQAFGTDLAGPAPIATPTTPADPRRTLAYVEGLLGEKNARHYHLFNPGPVNTTPGVKSALVHHDVCHRDSDYSEVVRRLSRKLRRVFQATEHHSILVLTGSGTAAMECAISSSIPRGKKILVIRNGAFGDRLAEIADLHEMPRVTLSYKWGERPAPADVARALDADPEIAAVVMIHHETSVGIMNPVQEIGAIVRARGRLLIVDAVSSLGAEDLDVVRDNIDICYSSANKCLHAISGVSFLCVAPRVWDVVKDVRPRVYYLDLKRYRRYAEELAQTPFTPAVSAYFALDVALDEFLRDGTPRRLEMYRTRNHKIREAFRRMGFGFFTDTGFESKTIMTPKVPDYTTFEEMMEEMKERGFIIYGCKDALKDKYFQVANMGDLDDAVIDSFLNTFAEVLSLCKRRRATSTSFAAERARKPPTQLEQPS